MEPLADFRVLRQHRSVEDRGGTQGKQADHRPNFEPLGLAVGQAEHVVEEAVLFVPHARVAAQVPHRRGDPQEVFDELECHVRVVRIGHRQLGGDFQHVLAEQRHPGGAVGLFQIAAGRQRRAAIEHADVVQPEEAALEDVASRTILAIDPPGEVEQQLLEAALEPLLVSLALLPFLQAVREDRRPGVDRRIDVAEIPLVGRNLAVGVHVPLAQHQLQLLLAEIRIDERQCDHVKGQIPGRVPGILPLVRHRDHVAVVHVVPVVVARRGLAGRLEGVGAALFQPVVHVVVVKLLAPQHSGQGLTHDIGRVGVERRGSDAGVELVGLLAPRLQHVVELAAERTRPSCRSCEPTRRARCR